MKTKSKIFILAATVAAAMSAAPAQAQNTTYAPGDIVLFFHQFGGSNTVMLNVGAGTTFRDATSNIMNIANIGSLLSNGTTGFGLGWFDASTLYWGAAGVFNNSTSTTVQTNGDPGRTIYTSSVRTSIGTEGTASSAGWSVDSNGSMTTGANGIIAMANRMETIATTTTLVEGTGSSNIDNQNPFNIAGTPTGSFTVFPGSVVGGFAAGSLGSIGGVNAEGALDLYRILATTNPVGTVIDPGQLAREGQFEGSFVIDDSGSVSFIVQPVPEPSSAVLLASSALLGGLIRRRKKNA